MRNVLIIMFALLLGCGAANAQSGKAPAWVKKGDAELNANYANRNYRFYYVRVKGKNYIEVENKSFQQLLIQMGIVVDAQGGIKTDVMKSGQDESNLFKIDFTVKAVPYWVTAKLVDSYHIDNKYGMIDYYALFMAPTDWKVNNDPEYDHISFDFSYGSKGLVRSIIPGMGQIYKGSKAKGYTIIGAQALSVAGIILTECTRADYAKKMKEQPEFALEYNTKSNNWETARNVCIGVAAAIYIYNLIDAAVSPGDKRIIVERKGFAAAPVVFDNGGVGVGFALNF